MNFQNEIRAKSFDFWLLFLALAVAIPHSATVQPHELFVKAKNIFDYFTLQMNVVAVLQMPKYILSDLFCRFGVAIQFDNSKQKQRKNKLKLKAAVKAHCTVWCRGQFINLNIFGWNSIMVNGMHWTFGIRSPIAIPALWHRFDVDRCKQDQISNKRKKRTQEINRHH